MEKKEENVKKKPELKITEEKEYLNEEEIDDKNVLHISVGFVERKTDDNFQLNENNNKRNKRSSSMAVKLMLKRYVPTIKPINAEFNPSPINLIGNDSIKKYEKLFSTQDPLKFNINKIKEEKYESEAKSGDEENITYKISDTSKSDSDVESDNKEEKKAINIKDIRKKLNKIKIEYNYKKYDDDSSITLYSNHNKSTIDRYSSGQKFIDKILGQESIQENIQGYYKKPPILGFLEMTETRRTSSVSSLNISDV